MSTVQSEGIKPADQDRFRLSHKNAFSCFKTSAHFSRNISQVSAGLVRFSVCCYRASAHQLLNNSLHQGGKGDALALPVVIDVLDQFWDHFCVRFRLKFVSFGDLRRDKVKIYY